MYIKACFGLILAKPEGNINHVLPLMYISHSVDLILKLAGILWNRTSG